MVGKIGVDDDRMSVSASAYKATVSLGQDNTPSSYLKKYDSHSRSQHVTRIDAGHEVKLIGINNGDIVFNSTGGMGN